MNIGRVAGSAIVLGIGCAVFAGVGTAQADQVNVWELQAGECIAGYQGGSVASVDVVPCEMPHDAEITAKLLPQFKEWPGMDEMTNAANVICNQSAVDQVHSLVFHYNYSWLAPTGKASWDHDSSILCLVAQVGGGQTVGSASQQIPLLGSGSAG